MTGKPIGLAVPGKLLQRVRQLRTQGRNFKSLAQGYGQWLSIRGCNSVDKEGQPIPWYTYPTIEYLSHLELSTLRVFEYGSGNSTLWWAARVSHVTSVEDDRGWYDKIKSSLNFQNVDYRLARNSREYFSMATNDFDIYIVDGTHRRECLEHVASLESGMMLILDNSDWYPKSVSFLQEELGWMQVDFHGFGPINNYTWTTSVFVNPARFTDVRYRCSLKSRCGLMQVADGDH